MRFQDMIRGGFKYIEEFTGPNRAKRRREEAAAKLELRTKKGPAKAKPRNWRRKLRKYQKARRKQSWKGGNKAP